MRGDQKKRLLAWVRQISALPRTRRAAPHWLHSNRSAEPVRTIPFPLSSPYYSPRSVLRGAGTGCSAGQRVPRCSCVSRPVSYHARREIGGIRWWQWVPRVIVAVGALVREVLPTPDIWDLVADPTAAAGAGTAPALDRYHRLHCGTCAAHLPDGHPAGVADRLSDLPGMGRICAVVALSADDEVTCFVRVGVLLPVLFCHPAVSFRF